MGKKRGNHKNKTQIIKVFVAGDHGVGKSCLLFTYIENKFPEKDLWMWINDFVVHNVLVGERSVRLQCFEPKGGERFHTIRPSYYRNIDVFLLVFSLVDYSSYEKIRTLWYPEISHFRPDATFILVGTKLDLREDKETIESLKDKNLLPITSEQGLQLAKEIAAVKYIECSALLQKGLKEVFEETVKLVPPKEEVPPNEDVRRCTLM